VNLFLLSATKYVSPFWLTMKQANELGGTVRRGEHSQIVVFWKVDEIANAETQTDPDSDEAGRKSRRHFLLRYYRLFNLEQCELPKAVLDRLPRIDMHHHDPIEACEKILANMPNPPEIVHAGHRAFYSPASDRVTMPPRGLFDGAEEYWSTFWHECGGHATGHPKRLNRRSINEAAPFGSPIYSFEELVVECSAAYLCPEAGISPAVIDNQTAYIQGWLKKWRARHFLSNQ
jgi:antirestriction protein ArdC